MGVYTASIAMEFYKQSDRYVAKLGDITVVYETDGHLAFGPSSQPDCILMLSLLSVVGKPITQDEFEEHMPYDCNNQEHVICHLVYKTACFKEKLQGDKLKVMLN